MALRQLRASLPVSLVLVGEGLTLVALVAAALMMDIFSIVGCVASIDFRNTPATVAAMGAIGSNDTLLVGSSACPLDSRSLVERAISVVISSSLALRSPDFRRTVVGLRPVSSPWCRVSSSRFYVCPSIVKLFAVLLSVAAGLQANCRGRLLWDSGESPD
ncbi:hypothetical protein MRX96_024804 [Rhipicephalus microplus]